MPLAWNEIRHRAIKFANENAKAVSEAGEKQTYWNEFFDVFGIARKTVASFEAPVKKLTIQNGEVFSGEVVDQFKAAEPFKFLPASLKWQRTSEIGTNANCPLH